MSDNLKFDKYEYPIKEDVEVSDTVLSNLCHKPFIRVVNEQDLDGKILKINFLTKKGVDIDKCILKKTTYKSFILSIKFKTNNEELSNDYRFIEIDMQTKLTENQLLKTALSPMFIPLKINKTLKIQTENCSGIKGGFMSYGTGGGSHDGNPLH